MGLMTAISLYTSRVILNVLGVEDFGIYSVVAGIAVLFSFFNNALYVSTQRFLTFEIGRNDVNEIRKIFTTSLNCHIVIALIVLFLSEIIGLWFLNNKLCIPEERLCAANIVFQFSLFVSVLGVINAPYIASIIAYEKMSFFAWTSIIDSLSKLLIVYLLSCNYGDKLVFYAGLLLIWAIIKAVVNYTYCHIKFINCRYVWGNDKKYFRSIMSFSMWNLFKTGAVIGLNQGNNVLINIFGGPVASAALGIANQINGTVYTFMQNVQTAFNPQITINYASRNMAGFHSLIIQSSKFSTFLLFFIAIPFLINTEYILNLWLKEVPPYTANLCQMAVISVYIDALTGPLNTAVMSEGKIRVYQICTSALWILAVPSAWLLLHSGMRFDYILIAKIASQLFTLIFSINYLKKRIGLPIKLYLKAVVLPSLLIFIVVILPIVVFVQLVHIGDMLTLIVSILLVSILLPIAIFCIGMNKADRSFLVSKIK